MFKYIETPASPIPIFFQAGAKRRRTNEAYKASKSSKLANSTSIMQQHFLNNIVGSETNEKFVVLIDFIANMLTKKVWVTEFVMICIPWLLRLLWLHGLPCPWLTGSLGLSGIIQV
jgi:hypothetical protein